MNEIILFGESDKTVSSSCTACSGCGEKSDPKCTVDVPTITAEELTLQLQSSVNKRDLGSKISVSFRDIHSVDLSEYQDVKTLINMSFSFPILTVNKKIKYMGPFDSEILLSELLETLEL